MEIDFKQCPGCGAANPKNNSECCRCHGDMTNVPLPLVEGHDKELPDPGYQPVLTCNEAEQIVLLGMLVAVAQLSLTIMEPDVPQELADSIIKLRRDVVGSLLRRHFQRTPTADELIILESSMVPASMTEGVKRFHRLMKETAVRSIDDLSADLQGMYQQVYAMNDQMVRYMESRHRGN